jgi:hypothetical protein
MVPTPKSVPAACLLAFTVASVVAASGLPAVADDSPAKGPPLEVTQVLYPTIDTDVRGTSTVPTHWLKTLEVANGGTPDSVESRSAYLKFDVKSHIPGTVSGARLEMTLNNAAAAGSTTLTT